MVSLKTSLLNVSKVDLTGFNSIPPLLKKFALTVNSLGAQNFFKSENIHKSNENQKQQLIRLIEDNKSKKIGFLGLSFKSGTDAVSYTHLTLPTKA